MKRILLSAVFICCFFLLHTHTHAQSLPHTLLWRISGNGLQQPSYLYGTMHLTDERVFHLGDSLYHAIEQTEGFAIEMNPEELLAYLIDEIQNEVDHASNIQELVDDHIYKKYGSALSRKLNKPVDKITARDILREKNKWITQSFKSGKMTTFLDAYLFDIARRQGKWTGGVEEMADQKNIANLIDETDIRDIAEERKPNADNLLRAYLGENLNAIDSMVNLSDSAYIDALLTRRNHKMALRMDSMAHRRTMVFAVGAAHLPGKEGVIALLKERGFELTPVFSSRKLKPSAYKLQPVALPWIEVNDSNSFYTVQMPGKPGNINSYGIEAMKMYFDIFNSTGYITLGMSLPYAKREGDSIALALADNIFKGSSVKKPVTLSGIKGTELEMTDEDGYKHGYVIHHGNMIYMAVGISSKRTAETDKALNKFLASFRIIDRPQDAAEEVAYTDSSKGFRITLPAPPSNSAAKEQPDNSGSIRSQLMICNDAHSGTYYFVGVNEAKPGYYIPNDSTSVEQIRANATNQITAATRDTSYLKNGHRVLEYSGTTQQSNVLMRTYYEFRGNRWYALIALYGDNPEEAARVQRFFESFSILPYPRMNWQMQSSDDQLLTTWSPAPLVYSRTDGSGETAEASEKYEAFDTIRADGYDIVASELGKYYWQNSDTAFWNTMARSSLESADSLLSQKTVSNGAAKGIEIIVRNAGASSLQRKRILLSGSRIFTLMTIQPAEEIDRSDVNRFFEAFRFNKPAPAYNYLASKTGILLRDIASSDSATRTEAREQLGNAPFTVQDLPELHQALIRSYTAGSAYELNTNELLLTAVEALNDPSSLAFAQEHYSTTQDAEAKNVLLQLMLHFHTRESYSKAGKLIAQSPPLKAPGYLATRELEDSLALTATILPDLLPFLKDTVLAADLLSVLNKLADSNFLDRQQLIPYEPDILRMANAHYKAMRIDSDAYYLEDYYLVRLLGKINTPDANSQLQDWSTLLHVRPMQVQAIDQLLTNKQAVSPVTLQQLAANMQTRLQLYRILSEHQQKPLFPKAFANQQAFSESMVYDVATEEDDEAAVSLHYLNQKICNFQDSNKRFFFFRVDFETEGETPYSLLACAGPFATDAGKLSEKEAVGYINYEDIFDAANWKSMSDELVTKMAEWYKKED